MLHTTGHFGRQATETDSYTWGMPDGYRTEPLANALREAATAHHEYEARHGKDENWQVWYARYIIDNHLI